MRFTQKYSIRTRHALHTDTHTYSYCARILEASDCCGCRCCLLLLLLLLCYRSYRLRKKRKKKITKDWLIDLTLGVGLKFECMWISEISKVKHLQKKPQRESEEGRGENKIHKSTKWKREKKAHTSRNQMEHKESPFLWWLLIVFVSRVNFIMRDLLCLNIFDVVLFVCAIVRQPK